ncbi:MAG TPA: hypothetical protein VGC72_09740 [Candidatus Elarobacter sp.]
MFVALALALQPLCSRAEVLSGVSDVFKSKDRVAFFEVYHIAHESTSYGVSVPLSDVISPSSQDYVRVSARNWRAVNALYEALSNTPVDRTAECPLRSLPYRLDVRWAIVVTYTDGSHDAVGFNDLWDCVQSSASPKAWRSGRGLFTYVVQTFPFMR